MLSGIPKYQIGSRIILDTEEGIICEISSDTGDYNYGITTLEGSSWWHDEDEIQGLSENQSHDDALWTIYLDEINEDTDE